MGRTDEIMRTMREQNIPIPVAPPPPAAAPLTKEDVARIVVDVLKVMQPAPAAASVGVGATPPGPVDPLASMDTMMATFERVEKMKTRMATVMGVDPDAEPPPPPPPPEVPAQLVEDKPPFGITPLPFTSFGEEKKPINYPTGVDGWVDWTRAFLASNPDITIAGFKVVAHIIDRGVIGQVVHMMQAKGNPQQQAVAQQAVREGLANGAAVHAPPQPPSIPPEPWAPTG